MKYWLTLLGLPAAGVVTVSTFIWMVAPPFVGAGMVWFTPLVAAIAGGLTGKISANYAIELTKPEADRRDAAREERRRDQYRSFTD